MLNMGLLFAFRTQRDVFVYVVAFFGVVDVVIMFQLGGRTSDGISLSNIMHGFVRRPVQSYNRL